VVRLTPLRGRLHDVQPIWAWADAERYGARAVFILRETDPSERARALQDLEAGLNPVLEHTDPELALAA
jgi:hypothetical protein